MIFLPHTREQSTILDLDSRFIARGTCIPNPLSGITDYKADRTDTTSKSFPDSRIRILLHGENLYRPSNHCRSTKRPEHDNNHLFK